MPKTEAHSHRLRRARGIGNQRGVTLIESLIAVGLLALGAAAVGDFMTGQIRHATDNHLSTAAYALAADELERIRALPFDQMAGASREEAAGDVAFAIASTVRDGVPAANMKGIEVRVSWSSPNGPQSIELHTVYAQVTPD
jgi:prepilin-type N-terminal cleavage/methylation domain-containing protein